MVTIAFPGLPTWNPFDPVGSLADEAKKAYIVLNETLQDFLKNPPTYSDRGILPALYSGGLEGAEYLAYVFVVIGIFVGVLLFKGAPIVKSFIVFAIVLGTSPFWIQIINEMHSFGNDLSAAADFYEPAKETKDGSIDSDLIGLAVFLINGFWSFVLAAIIVSYELVIVAVKFMTPVIFSTSGVSKRMHKLAEVFLAIGLVATVFGRAFAQFFLNLGQLAADTFPFSDTLVGKGIYIFISLVAAVIMQVVLVFVTYLGIQAVEGRIRAAVAGTVVTQIKQRLKVDIENIRRRQPPPVPVYSVPSPNADPSKADQAKDGAKRAGKAAARKTSQAASAAAYGAGHPEVGAVLTVAGNKFFKDK